jgi:hypothetical protein
MFMSAMKLRIAHHRRVCCSRARCVNTWTAWALLLDLVEEVFMVGRLMSRGINIMSKQMLVDGEETSGSASKDTFVSGNDSH